MQQQTTIDAFGMRYLRINYCMDQLCIIWFFSKFDFFFDFFLTHLHAAAVAVISVLVMFMYFYRVFNYYFSENQNHGIYLGTHFGQAIYIHDDLVSTSNKSLLYKQGHR